MSSAVEDFIEELESDSQREIMFLLHDLLVSYPTISSCIRYSIPFYDSRSWICYLNPQKKSEGVELVFIRATELVDEHQILDSKGRKQVAGIAIRSPKEVDFDQIGAILQEAIILDEQVPYKGPRK